MPGNVNVTRECLCEILASLEYVSPYYSTNLYWGTSLGLLGYIGPQIINKDVNHLLIRFRHKIKVSVTRILQCY